MKMLLNLKKMSAGPPLVDAKDMLSMRQEPKNMYRNKTFIKKCKYQLNLHTKIRYFYSDLYTQIS